MITYKLDKDGEWAQKFIDGVPTGEWANTQTNQEYLAWIAAGNTPIPYSGAK